MSVYLLLIALCNISALVTGILVSINAPLWGICPCVMNNLITLSMLIIYCCKRN